MDRNYFVCSVGQPGKGYDAENLTRCITGNCFVLNEGNEHKGSIGQITEGDILILKYQNHFIAYGRAVSGLKNEDISNGMGWSWKVDVNLWVTGNHAGKYGIKAAQETGTAYDTVKKVERGFALGKMEEIGFPF